MCSSMAGPCGFQLDGFLNFEELKGGFYTMCHYTFGTVITGFIQM